MEVTSLAEDGPAAKAGIKEGDVVLEYQRPAGAGHRAVSAPGARNPAGRQVKITVWRAGAAQTLTATVGENRQGHHHHHAWRRRVELLHARNAAHAEH